MIICISIYGQQRNLDFTKKLLPELISGNNTFYFVYTGWEHEEPLYETIFPDHHVRRISRDHVLDIYMKKYKKYTLDHSNPTKSLERYLTGLFIKKQSAQTVAHFSKQLGIIFDLVVTVRTDTKVYNGKPSYIPLKPGTIIIAKEPDWDIYAAGACCDTIMICNYSDLEQLVDQIEYMDHCVVPGTLYFHPETSFYQYLQLQLFHIVRDNFSGFIYLHEK